MDADMKARVQALIAEQNESARIARRAIRLMSHPADQVAYETEAKGREAKAADLESLLQDAERLDKLGAEARIVIDAGPSEGGRLVVANLRVTERPPLIFPEDE